jgi:subtilisin family serine protease
MASDVLIEVFTEIANPFEAHTSATESVAESELQAEGVLEGVGLRGITLDQTIAPVPMFFSPLDSVARNAEASLTLESLQAGPAAKMPELGGRSVVIAARVDDARVRDLEKQERVIVWPNSELTLVEEELPAGMVDCRPFKPGVTIDTIRATLGVGAAWRDGFRGRNVAVGIIDEGVNGATYRISGGFSRPGSPRPPGTAPVTSHGSMCAADVLIAAPDALIYDYPFLGVPNSGGALQMFQAVLDQRRRDGTPHVTNNSYGFVGVPDRNTQPRHEIHDINHPIHRKVREVTAAGVACFFAAGNCGSDCPSGNCHPSGIGPGQSIHASNSLNEVITVAAVNNGRERIGYSSQGPGMFDRNKPDVASYSHIFANFGPGRPGGTGQPFDNGTSAATPVAAGVGAMLLSAFPRLTPGHLKRALIATAIGSHAGWNPNFGNGVIDAGRAYQFLRTRPIV